MPALLRLLFGQVAEQAMRGELRAGASCYSSARTLGQAQLTPKTSRTIKAIFGSDFTKTRSRSCLAVRPLKPKTKRQFPTFPSKQVAALKKVA